MSPAIRAFPLSMSMALAALVVAVSPAFASDAPPIVDGRDLSRDFGPPLWVQTLGTSFGNNTDPNPDVANGSEFDAAYMLVRDGILYLAIAGNLETNFNKFELFFDVAPGGQNRLRGDNADVDYDGLNRMGDDGSSNGLTFDVSFDADYYITYSTGIGGTGLLEHYASAATLPTDGGGVGALVGGGVRSAVGAIEGNGPRGGRIRVHLDNSNVLGVAGLGQPMDGPPDLVFSGLELAVDLYELGWDGSSAIRVAGFINGASHDFASNQFLGGLPDGTDSLADPRTVNLQVAPGEQYLIALSARDVDLDGDGTLDTIDTNPHVYNPEQSPGLDVHTVGFRQLTYLDSDEAPLDPYSDVGAFVIVLPTRIETLWLNVVVDGVWVIDNEPIFPSEVDPYAHPTQESRVNFLFGIPAGTPVNSVGYQFTVTRASFAAFPPGVPTSVASVGEEAIQVGEFDPGAAAMRGVQRGDDPEHRPTSTRHTRPGYHQADLQSKELSKACSAGAVASSIKWLLEHYKLKNGPDGQAGTADDYDPSLDDLVNELAGLMGIKPGRGAGYSAIVEAKKKFIAKHKLPLTVESNQQQTGDAAIKDIYEQMKKGQDVELQLVREAFRADDIAGHTVSLVGINKATDKNGNNTYDVTVRDDKNQWRPRTDRDNPDGRERSSSVRTAPGFWPGLPGLRNGSHIYSWTAESPTKAQTANASTVVAEDAGETTREALNSGGAADEQQSRVIAGCGANAVHLTEKLMANLEASGFGPGTPEHTAAEQASETALYLRRAAFDVMEYLPDPAAQQAALLEADTYAWDLVFRLMAFSSLFPPDADRDDVPDAIDNCGFANPDQHDCDGSGIGDVCELNELSDCDSNGYLDLCELAAGSSLDCNANGRLDACDLPCDFDGDDDVDVDDYDSFASCVTGPCGSTWCSPALYGNECCMIADVNEDGAIDLIDYAAMIDQPNGP